MVNFLQNLNFLFELFFIFDFGETYCLACPNLLGILVPNPVNYSVGSTAQDIFLVHLILARNREWIFDDHCLFFDNKTFLFVREG